MRVDDMIKGVYCDAFFLTNGNLANYAEQS